MVGGSLSDLELIMDASGASFVGVLDRRTVLAPGVDGPRERGNAVLDGHPDVVAVHEWAPVEFIFDVFLDLRVVLGPAPVPEERIDTRIGVVVVGEPGLGVFDGPAAGRQLVLDRTHAGDARGDLPGAGRLERRIDVALKLDRPARFCSGDGDL